MQQVVAQLKSLLSKRHLPLVLALLAFVLMIWGLDEGFLMDDYGHRAQLLGKLYEGSGDFLNVLNDMFALARTSEQIAQLKETGDVPWWGADELRFSNWRPLAALTHWLDYRLFPHSAALMHAHSLLWLSGAVLVVTMFYRRVSGATWVAGLAGLMYLLDEANGFPALWIANRNALIAVALGAAALVCHHHGRNRGSLKHAIGTAVLFLLALLATEAGIATFAYVLAYALCLDRNPWRQRLVSLAPALAVLVLWRVVYSALGHGAYECGIIDPGRTPWAFMQVAIVRAPVLLMGQLGLISVDIIGFLSPSWQLITALICAGTLVLMAMLFVPVLRSDRCARFYGLGMILSVVPICGTFPSSRNLMFVAIGGFGLVAQLLAGLVTSKTKIRVWKRTAWAVMIGLLILALPSAGLARIGQPGATRLMTRWMTPRLPWDEMPTSLSHKQVVVVSAPNPMGMFYVPLIRTHEGETVPRSMHVLSPGFGDLEVERKSVTSLVVRSKADNLFTEGSGSPLHITHMFKMCEEIFHAHWDHLVVGRTRGIAKLQIQVTQVGAHGAPREVVFTFDRPLEHESLVWLEFDWFGYRFYPFSIPQVGETREFAGPKYFSLGRALRFVGNQVRGKMENP